MSFCQWFPQELSLTNVRVTCPECSWLPCGPIKRYQSQTSTILLQPFKFPYRTSASKIERDLLIVHSTRLLFLTPSVPSLVFITVSYLLLRQSPNPYTRTITDYPIFISPFPILAVLNTIGRNELH